MRGITLLISVFMLISKIISITANENIQINNNEPKRLGFLIEGPGCAMIGNPCDASNTCCEGLTCSEFKICRD